MKMNECVFDQLPFLRTRFRDSTSSSEWASLKPCCAGSGALPGRVKSTVFQPAWAVRRWDPKFSHQKVSIFFVFNRNWAWKKTKQTQSERKGHENPEDLNPVDIFEDPLIGGRVKWSLGGWEILGSLQIHVSSVQNPWLKFEGILIDLERSLYSLVIFHPPIYPKQPGTLFSLLMRFETCMGFVSISNNQPGFWTLLMLFSLCPPDRLPVLRPAHQCRRGLSRGFINKMGMQILFTQQKKVVKHPPSDAWFLVFCWFSFVFIHISSHELFGNVSNAIVYL